MEDIAVSVIMPVYNEQKYLPMALESLSKQTMRNFELICVDDGSTDGSVDILEQYRDRFPFMTVIRQENQYAGVARNNGMAVAKGKYLSFLDADDYFKPDMLEEAYSCAEQNAADIVLFDGGYFTDRVEETHDSAGMLKIQYMKDGSSVLDGEMKKKYLFNLAGAAPWNKIFLREFICRKNLKFQATKRANDIYFVELALAYAEKIAIVNKKLIYYRRENPDSLQGTKDESPIAPAEVLLELKNVLCQEGLYEEYKISFQNFVVTICINYFKSLKTGKSFLTLHDAFQKWIYKEFELSSLHFTDYYVQEHYVELRNIMKYDAVSYLMEKNQASAICVQAKNHEIREKNKEIYELKQKNKEIYELKQKNKEIKRELAVKSREAKEKFVFPFWLVPRGCDIVLYAAGNVGKNFYTQIKKTDYCNIYAWVDARADEKNDERISLPSKKIFQGCDFIIISILDSGAAETIRADLVGKYEVANEKVIWTYPCLEE